MRCLVPCWLSHTRKKGVAVRLNFPIWIEDWSLKGQLHNLILKSANTGPWLSHLCFLQFYHLEISEAQPSHPKIFETWEPVAGNEDESKLDDSGNQHTLLNKKKWKQYLVFLFSIWANIYNPKSLLYRAHWNSNK